MFQAGLCVYLQPSDEKRSRLTREGGERLEQWFGGQKETSGEDWWQGREEGREGKGANYYTT